jgi:hypothetical protein
MKAQLEAARVVVRALAADPPCADLLLLTRDWDGRPGPLWRKRIARHTRECGHCTPAWSGLVAAERLLVGLALVVPLPRLVAAVTGAVRAHPVALPAAQSIASAAYRGVPPKAVAATRHLLTAVVTVGAVAVAGLIVTWNRDAETPPRPAAAAAPAAAAPTPSAATAVSAPSPTPSARAIRSVGPSRRAAAPARSSAKKGVGTWQFPGLRAALGDVRAGWFYNWSATDAGMSTPPAVEFVPMIWGAANATDATVTQARGQGDVLLTFNEPDLAEQSNMTVDRALELWPRLQTSGMRLGSPAVAFGADTPGGWLDRFMAGATSRGLTVDFIALHWYGSDFGPAAVGHLRSYLDAVHRRYGKPIWVTEYALIDFTGSPKFPNEAQQAAFVTGSTSMMEDLPYVERYAWFALPAVGENAGTGLYRDGSHPTAAGAAYRAAGG